MSTTLLRLAAVFVGALVLTVVFLQYLNPEFTIGWVAGMLGCG